MTEIVEYKIDSTLKALLLFAKSDVETTIDIVKVILRPIYHDDIRLIDIVNIVYGAWEKAFNEPRFEMRCKSNAIINLLLAPVEGFHAVELWGPKTLETTYSVEEYYTSVVKAMLSDLRFTRVDWLNLK